MAAHAPASSRATIQALTIHGRTRACKFSGHAEYDTIAEIVQKLNIPVIANGDIESAAQAKLVLHHTGAAAVMIGRAALGQPWIFEQIRAYLESGTELTSPTLEQKLETMHRHLLGIHQQYGELQGVRIARKHMGWYLQKMGCQVSSKNFNQLQSAEEQREFLSNFGACAPIQQKIAA